MLVYKKVLLDEILVRSMTGNCFRICCSLTMADFMCISVVLWGLCADGHDEIKKKNRILSIVLAIVRFASLLPTLIL